MNQAVRKSGGKKDKYKAVKRKKVQAEIKQKNV